jgi:hypothetical protein
MRRYLMSSFTDILTWQVNVREQLCAALQAIGIQARLSDRGCKEEEFTSGRGESSGVIDIATGPIRWVGVREREDCGEYRGSGFHPEKSWYTEYIVPDSKIGSFPKVRLKSVEVKSFPLVGKVTDLRWEGNDFGLGIIDQLACDVSLNRRLIDDRAFFIYRGLEIGAYPEYSCWILTTTYYWEDGSRSLMRVLGIRKRKLPAISRELWNCLRTIAQQLLVSSSSSTIS